MKMQEKKLKRFNIYSKVANVLFILFIVFGVFAVIAGLGIFTYTTIEDINFASIIFDEILTDSEATIQIIGGTDTIIPNSLVFTIIFYGVFTLAFTAFIFKTLANMFKKIVHTKTPFNKSTVKSLKIVGIAFFALAGISYIFSAVMHSSFAQTITLAGFDGIDYKYILFGVLILSLAEIFEFGMNLQQDSESIV